METKQCPKEVAEAIFKVQQLVRRIGHDAQNDFAKYAYVSIDRYYESVRPWLNEAGLLIIPNEIESGLSPDGKTLKMIFEFTLMHESGAVWECPLRRTVYLQYTGAQSCGSALSYAEKFVMRTLFKIPTGEKDAEAEATHIADADAIAPVSKGQDSELHFDYIGAPYRIFNSSKTVVNSFTDVRGWGLALKKKASNDHSVMDSIENTSEVNRIRRGVEDDQTLTEKAKANLLKSIDSLLLGEETI
jgi:hypothetical protein